MQPSMSNVIITTASPPAPLRMERGVDSEFPLLIDYILFALFVLLSHISFSKHHILPLWLEGGVDSEFPPTY